MNKTILLLILVSSISAYSQLFAQPVAKQVAFATPQTTAQAATTTSTAALINAPATLTPAKQSATTTDPIKKKTKKKLAWWDLPGKIKQVVEGSNHENEIVLKAAMNGDMVNSKRRIAADPMARKVQENNEKTQQDQIDRIKKAMGE